MVKITKKSENLLQNFFIALALCQAFVQTGVNVIKLFKGHNLRLFAISKSVCSGQVIQAKSHVCG
jgi:hypothetical protein